MNAGIEMPISTMPVMPRSRSVRARVALMMPVTMPASSHSTAAARISDRLAGSASLIIW